MRSKIRLWWRIFWVEVKSRSLVGDWQNDTQVEIEKHERTAGKDHWDRKYESCRWSLGENGEYERDQRDMVETAVRNGEDCEAHLVDGIERPVLYDLSWR